MSQDHDPIELAYTRLAPFYRHILVARAHFDAQATVVLEKAARLGLGHAGGRILDAACGSGDVLTALARTGYTDVWGVDACRAMLAQAQQPELVESGRLIQCRWEDLQSYFKEHGKFDMVYIMGHALPHAREDDIPEILGAIFNGLRPRGLFVFDMRNWTRDTRQNLVQAGRSTDSFRELGQFDVGGKRFDVDDICSYDRNRQQITYRFRRVGADGTGVDQEESAVSYAMFVPETARAWMLKAGFKDVEIERPESYPYVLISGRCQNL